MNFESSLIILSDCAQECVGKIIAINGPNQIGTDEK